MVCFSHQPLLRTKTAVLPTVCADQRRKGPTCGSLSSVLKNVAIRFFEAEHWERRHVLAQKKGLLPHKSLTAYLLVLSNDLLGLSALFLMTFLFLLQTPFERHIADSLDHFLRTRIMRPVLEMQPQPKGIIVLGGTPRRVATALDLAKRYPNIPIVLSGPGDPEVKLAKANASVRARLEVDHRAQSTYENAVFSKDLVKPRTGECWALVTSPYHMPRALGAFQAVGFPVFAWPAEDTFKNPHVRSHRVWHEVVGLLYYWVTGRTKELLPQGSTSDLGCQS